MDKIGEYLPFIVAALYFIYSFVRKANKKKAEENAGKTTLPGGIPNKDIPIRQVKPNLQPENKRVNYEIIFDEKTTGTDQFLSVMDEVVEEERLTLNLDDADELKKGIIFAEIFNRKY